jgi:hypothetical protein
VVQGIADAVQKSWFSAWTSELQLVAATAGALVLEHPPPVINASPSNTAVVRREEARMPSTFRAPDRRAGYEITLTEASARRQARA